MIQPPIASLASLVAMAAAVPASPSGEDRAQAAARRVTPTLTKALKPHGAAIGDPVFIRIVKEPRLCELWIKTQENDRYTLFKTYDIAGMSGSLGPKKKEGDMQAPEGFYATASGLLNPRSNYHLSFNIGYPNAYDTAQGYTGSFIMLHGKDVSIGCFAMTDPGIEEIYTLVSAALQQGQTRVPIQIYPFPITEENLQRHRESPHIGFWKQLAPAWQYTERHHAPAPVAVVSGAYTLPQTDKTP